MIALFVALLLLIVNIATIYPHPGLAPVQPAIDFYKEHQSDVLLVLVVFYLGLYITGRLNHARAFAKLEEAQDRSRDQGSSAEAALLEVNAKLKTDVRGLEIALDNSQSELFAQKDQVLKLQNALADEQKHRMSAEQQLHKRSPMIDAEIVHLLSLFQSKGRLLDFLMDDITPFSDDQVGRAARVVHQGCKAVITEYFSISAVHEGREGDSVSIDTKAPSHYYRLVGRVTGEPPYRGRILHQGWKTHNISLPRVTRSDGPEVVEDEFIISPAEVEVG